MPYGDTNFCFSNGDTFFFWCWDDDFFLKFCFSKNVFQIFFSSFFFFKQLFQAQNAQICTISGIQSAILPILDICQESSSQNWTLRWGHIDNIECSDGFTSPILNTQLEPHRQYWMLSWSIYVILHIQLGSSSQYWTLSRSHISKIGHSDGST